MHLLIKIILTYIQEHVVINVSFIILKLNKQNHFILYKKTQGKKNPRLSLHENNILIWKKKFLMDTKW